MSRSFRPALRGAALLATVSATAVAQAPPPRSTLSVFAAASLTDVFGEIKRVYEHHHPGVSVRFNFAGSNQLALQIEQRAAADLFASADERWMSYVEERRLLAEPARMFAGNRMVVVVPRAGRTRITRLQDLTRRGIKLVIAHEDVPAGEYTRQVLRNLSLSPQFGNEFDARVLVNVVSLEESVKGVLGKVQLGQADAGFVYRSDVTAPVAPKVRLLNIPDAFNVDARYPIAVLRGARQAALAREFVELLLSAEGQRIVASHGLVRIGATR